MDLVHGRAGWKLHKVGRKVDLCGYYSIVRHGSVKHHFRNVLLTTHYKSTASNLVRVEIRSENKSNGRTLKRNEVDTGRWGDRGMVAAELAAEGGIVIREDNAAT